LHAHQFLAAELGQADNRVNAERKAAGQVKFIYALFNIFEGRAILLFRCLELGRPFGDALLKLIARPPELFRRLCAFVNFLLHHVKQLSVIERQRRNLVNLGQMLDGFSTERAALVDEVAQADAANDSLP